MQQTVLSVLNGDHRYRKTSEMYGVPKGAIERRVAKLRKNPGAVKNPLDQLQRSFQKRKKRCLSATSSRWQECCLVSLRMNFKNWPMTLPKGTVIPANYTTKREWLATIGREGLWPGIQTSCHLENLNRLQKLEPWASIGLQSHLLWPT